LNLNKALAIALLAAAAAMFAATIAAVAIAVGGWGEPADEPEAAYTVCFDAGGGDVAYSVEVARGDALTEPDPPEREGAVFRGWYADPGLVRYWSFSTGRVSGDMTLYAAWDPSPCLVTFDPMGGAFVPSAVVGYGSAVEEPAAPGREGYELEGWYRDPACSQKWDFSADEARSDMRLYAKWSRAG
jgi:uncharacterized repeat protein (TIGR02543 family)